MEEKDKITMPARDPKRPWNYISSLTFVCLPDRHTLKIGTHLVKAILIGLFPSLVVLSVGLLPVALAPMIPFIMVGNAILVLVFSKLKTKNFWLAVLSASFLKFLFLFAGSSIIVNLISQNAIAKQVALAMSYLQFITAIEQGALLRIYS